MSGKGAGLFYVSWEPRWIVEQLIFLENINPQAEIQIESLIDVVIDLSREQGLEVAWAWAANRIMNKLGVLVVKDPNS